MGGVQTLSRAKLSYEEAQIALNTRNADKDVAIFDLLDLEILLGSIQPEVRERYIARVASGICSEDRLPLLEYFAHGMSLKQTAEACFMHKNSVQYRLDRVARNTGYDPRHFPDAVVLYLALRLKDEFLQPVRSLASKAGW